MLKRNECLYLVSQTSVCWIVGYKARNAAGRVITCWNVTQNSSSPRLWHIACGKRLNSSSSLKQWDFRSELMDFFFLPHSEIRVDNNQTNEVLFEAKLNHGICQRRCTWLCMAVFHHCSFENIVFCIMDPHIPNEPQGEAQADCSAKL